MAYLEKDGVLALSWMVVIMDQMSQFFISEKK
jgi:hypothetical protein